MSRAGQREFAGYGPRHGDEVERFGVVTSYFLLSVGQVAGLAGVDEHGALVAVHASGHAFVSRADDAGRGTRVLLADLDPGGLRREMFSPFIFEGQEMSWHREVIRDVDSSGTEYDWSAIVCLPTKNREDRAIWSDAYAALSAARHRMTANTARHARRQRLEVARVERFDPQEIFDRDRWLCGICGGKVDRSSAWPDPMSPSLDHIIPLAAGGLHSRSNTQLAHWICNVRKGARTM